MQQEKKYWFTKISLTLWIPISWEGWLTTALFILSLFLINMTNDVSTEDPFSLRLHGPMILEMFIAIIALYWVTKGYVKY